MSVYEILNEQGGVVTRIVADKAFVEKYYSDGYRLVEGSAGALSDAPAVLTVLQLRRLFTLSEKVALEDAIKDGNSAVKVFMDDLAVADFVDLSDTLVIEGIQFLVQHGFLTQARADQILANEMPDA